MFASWTAISAFTYMITHPVFFIHLIGMSILSCLGQFFVYRMIKQFKQHIVPFVITTRKIVTIFISILYYHHKTTAIQMSGVFIVFFAVIY
jgi:drug/metabolite transporter (DMT)-like permease